MNYMYFDDFTVKVLKVMSKNQFYILIVPTLLVLQLAGANHQFKKRTFGR